MPLLREEMKEKTSGEEKIKKLFFGGVIRAIKKTFERKKVFPKGRGT